MITAVEARYGRVTTSGPARVRPGRPLPCPGGRTDPRTLPSLRRPDGVAAPDVAVPALSLQARLLRGREPGMRGAPDGDSGRRRFAHALSRIQSVWVVTTSSCGGMPSTGSSSCVHCSSGSEPREPTTRSSRQSARCSSRRSRTLPAGRIPPRRGGTADAARARRRGLAGRRRYRNDPNLFQSQLSNRLRTPSGGTPRCERAMSGSNSRSSSRLAVSALRASIMISLLR